MLNDTAQGDVEVLTTIGESHSASLRDEFRSVQHACRIVSLDITDEHSAHVLLQDVTDADMERLPRDGDVVLGRPLELVVLGIDCCGNQADPSPLVRQKKASFLLNTGRAWWR